MVKEPHPGRVKTRLGADIGMVKAAWWFRHQSQQLIARLAIDPRWQTILAVAPDHEGLFSRVWQSNVKRVPQGRGDLGDRMARLFHTLPGGPVVIIGADIPDIRPTHIASSFRSLGGNDVVFGPAEDGGYWLVGMKRSRPVRTDIFGGVRWSTEYALEDSIARLGGMRIAKINRLRDVDRAADL
ncbi:MAG: TIGR04282 family arsenosugar biosynthesis glycosyltransferase [Rhodobacterales bacterium]